MLSILSDAPTENIALGRPRHRWEDNVSMNLKEIGVNTNIWIHSPDERDSCRALENAALYLHVVILIILMKKFIKYNVLRSRPIVDRH